MFRYSSGITPELSDFGRCGESELRVYQVRASDEPAFLELAAFL